MVTGDRIPEYHAGSHEKTILDMLGGENTVDSFEQEFRALKEEISSSSDLKRLLQDSSIKKPERIKAALRMLKGNYGMLVKTILVMAITMGREEDFEDIYLVFKELVTDFKNQVCVEVISAIELDGGTLAKIKKEVDLKTGMDVIIRNIVDADILGGLVIKIGGKIIDFSARSKLEDMRSKLKAIKLRGEEFGTEN